MINLIKMDLYRLFKTKSYYVMILCIFVSIYVNGEQKNGYIKNIAGQLEKRSMLVLSKLVAVSVEVFSMLLVFVLVSAISGKIAFGDKLICSSAISLLKLLGIEYVLHLATSSTVMAITLIFRSSGVGITYGLLDSMGLVASVLGIINVFINKNFKFKDFNVLEYTVRSCITKLSITFTTEIIIKSLIISIVFISISTILAMISMQKRDVK